jgi:hypothetical protein
MQITKVAPDFDLLFESLRQRLEQKQTWIDILPTNVGTTIMDMFAGAGVTCQYNIELALRESFLIRAQRPSSIYTATRNFGITIGRKVPAGTYTTLTNNGIGAVFIAPYSKFILEDMTFFNRQQIVIGTGQTVSEIPLYNGNVYTHSTDLDLISDLELYEHVLPVPNFEASEQDLLVYTQDKITGQTRFWNPTDRALWEHTPDDQVFYTSTSENGSPSFLFGDGTNGRMLERGNTLNVRYVITPGASTNTTRSGLRTIYANNPLITGYTTTSLLGGANEKPAHYYKKFAPHLFRSRKRLISEMDYKAGIITYPGVADATILSQRHIAPNNPAWRNVIRICVLPINSETLGGANPNPRSAAWTQLRQWLEPKIHQSLVIQTWNPTKVPVEIQLKVAIAPNEDPTEIKTLVTELILQLFEKKPGILGRQLTLSDITDAAKSVCGVDYIEVIKPLKSIVPQDKLSYVCLQGLPVIDVVMTERVS